MLRVILDEFNWKLKCAVLHYGLIKTRIQRKIILLIFFFLYNTNSVVIIININIIIKLQLKPKTYI